MNNAENSVRNLGGNYSFDLTSTLKDISRRWYIILFIAVVSAMTSFVVSTQTYTPQYSTSITMLVQSKTSGQDNLTEAARIANIFKTILSSSQLQNAAAEELGYSSFPGTLSCSVVEDTNILSFTVISDSPVKSYRLLYAVLDSYPTFTKHAISTIVLQTIEEPIVPVYPINSFQPFQNFIMGFGIGAVATLAVIVVLSYFKDTIKKESEIENKLNVNRIVSVPRQKKKLKLKERLKGVKKSLSLLNPVIDFAFKEAFKRLRRIVVSDSKNNNRKVYAVTSSLENEGKTTIAVNLALALGKMDYKVLMIDSDLRKPAVAKYLDKKIESGHSLIDFLNGKAEMSDVFIYDDILKITYAGCNNGTSKANELITSEKMKQFISVSKELYDFIIMDTPPLAFVSDAEDVMCESDASILVVRRDVANALTVNDTVDIILQTGVNLMGCVYNDSEHIPLTGNSIYEKYGYGYGYGYGKYGYGKYGYGKYGYGYGKYPHKKV